jgi:DNA-binding beta-propeller fold protein YncE
MGVSGSTLTTLNYPAGIAIDPQTRSLYIADYINRWIRMLTQAAMQLSSTPTMTFFANPASSPCLWGVAVDSSGNVYFTDDCSSLVYVATSSGVVSKNLF